MRARALCVSPSGREYPMSERAFPDDLSMPDDERMDPAELRVTIGFLGLRQRDLAEVLGVAERTVRYWLVGTYPIPDGVRLEVEQLERHTTETVGEIVAAYLDGTLSPQGDPTMLTYRTDADLWAAHPRIEPLPASWWDQVVARVALKVVGLVIRDATPSDPPMPFDLHR